MCYLSTAAKEGKEAIFLQCPEYGCNRIIKRSVFVKFFQDNPELLKRYDKFVAKNFVEVSSSSTQVETKLI